MHPLLQEYRENLNYFFQGFDFSTLEEVLEEVECCPGIVLFSGVGKSGFVAEKMAASLASIGLRTRTLCPLNALHGDLGHLRQGDLLICLSRSGQTPELLRLLPHVRAKGVRVVAVLSQKPSNLAMLADRVLFLPLRRELCPFNLAPTTSAVLQMILADLLLVSLMKRRQLDQAVFMENHPSGAIGARLLLRVEQVMHRDNLPLCRRTDCLIDLLVLLSSKGFGMLAVLGPENTLEGVFTDGDLRRALQHHKSAALDQPVENFMTRTPKTIAPSASAWQALEWMEKPPNPITVLPVVEEDRFIGLVKMHDLIQTGVLQ